MISTEVEPFAKTGGLGDVLGALPKALATKGIDVRVVMPRYKAIPEKYKRVMKFKQYLYVAVGWRSQYCGVFEYHKNGVTYYFIDNEYYFGSSNLYGEYNEMERFSYFSKAALEMLQIIDFKPDIIHCHDWQSGIVPVLLDAFYKKTDFYKDIKTVFTIHNLKYQGRVDKKTANDFLGLPAQYYASDKLEFYGDANYMKGGLVYADFITTVSPTYADEIKDPYFGEGLDGLLRAKSGRLGGILNGIDYDIYSPVNDKYIVKQYTDRSYLKGKRENKLALQTQLGLEVDKDVPLIGIVSRLTDQKGFDLVAGVMNDILQRKCQMVVLGTGTQKYEELFQRYAWDNHRRVSANIMFDNAMAHKIYAGADMFLMPSQYEPCGLGQIISLSYGTLPIVRETGGLKDTVTPYNEFTGEGNGFSFSTYNAHDMLSTIDKALNLYEEPKKWNAVVRAAMKCNFSWDESAQHYINVYEHIIG